MVESRSAAFLPLCHTQPPRPTCERGTATRQWLKMGGPDMITTSEAWYRLSDVLFWYQSLPENSLEVSCTALIAS